jgi:hypothetical protein
MSRYQARKRAQTLLADEASRSDICTFLNDLADSKILSNRAIDALADTLAADRSNGPAVLNAILSMLPYPKDYPTLQ